jgi:hypothetical protein
VKKTAGIASLVDLMAMRDAVIRALFRRPRPSEGRFWGSDGEHTSLATVLALAFTYWSHGRPNHPMMLTVVYPRCLTILSSHGRFFVHLTASIINRCQGLLDAPICLVESSLRGNDVCLAGLPAQVCTATSPPAGNFPSGRQGRFAAFEPRDRDQTELP